MKINVIGAGTWGLTLASMLSQKGHNITVWQRNNKKTTYLRNNLTYTNLPKLKIPSSIKFTSDYKELHLESLYVLAIPTNSLSPFIQKINNPKSQYLIACKGFDLETKKLPSEILNKINNVSLKNIAVISGPNHAEEISLSKISASVVCSLNTQFAKGLQNLFSSNHFRVYTSDDIYGVQIGGAVKNVIAIASGICAGLNLGDNAQSALVSRGMNEIIQLSKLYNIKLETLYGLSGLGDLIATSYSKHSRNRKLGFLLSKGMRLDDALNKIGMVVEGVNTTKIIYRIITKKNLQMPICTEVYNILYKSYDPKNSINNLMMRDLKEE